MYLKMIPTKLVVTTTDNPCIPIDGFTFIWTLIMIACMQTSWLSVAKMSAHCEVEEKRRRVC